jgi:hypothetical protein
MKSIIIVASLNDIRNNAKGKVSFQKSLIKKINQMIGYNNQCRFLLMANV